MKLYEFEGKDPPPEGWNSSTQGNCRHRPVEEARKAASAIGYPVVIKAQLLTGQAREGRPHPVRRRMKTPFQEQPLTSFRWRSRVKQ